MGDVAGTTASIINKINSISYVLRFIKHKVRFFIRENCKNTNLILNKCKNKSKRCFKEVFFFLK